MASSFPKAHVDRCTRGLHNHREVDRVESFEQIQFSTDLIEAAECEATFLESVDMYGSILYDDAVVKNAIRRYELLWLPLQVGSYKCIKRKDISKQQEGVHPVEPQVCRSRNISTTTDRSGKIPTSIDFPSPN